MMKRGERLAGGIVQHWSELIKNMQTYGTYIYRSIIGRQVFTRIHVCDTL